MIVKTNQEIKKLSISGNYLSNLLALLWKLVVVGNSGADLNEAAKNFLKKNNLQSNFFNYHGFPSCICVSVNNVILHGVPNSTKFKSGDLVSVDAGLIYQGYHSDSAFSKIVESFPDKKKSTKAHRLLATTKLALEKSLQIIKPGQTIFDISDIIHNVVISHGFFVSTEYGGHGIGQNLHEDPFIPNFVPTKISGLKNCLIKENMVFAIEVMTLCTNQGTFVSSKDGWSVCSNDSCVTCHFETMISVTKDGCKQLTALPYSESREN